MSSSNSALMFTNFLHLPYEIRRLLYLLCTPPRIVYIPLQFDEEVEEGYDQFMEDFSSQVNPPPLHPDMVYFAKGWQHRARNLSFKQRPLESFGFTTTKTPSRPWEPSAETPEIPLHALHEEPDLAFVISRSCDMRSSAEIPPFLHVSPESRQTLIAYGYHLAFGGRSSPPKVWFHFERDTLYLDGRDRDGRLRDAMSTLCNTDWSLSFIRPLDLSSLRHVALTHPSSLCIADDSICAGLLEALDLLPGLRKLTIVTLDQHELRDYFPQTRAHISQGSSGTDSRKSLTNIPAMDVDAFVSLPWARYYYEFLGQEMVTYYRSRDEQDVTPFFTHQTYKFPSRLRKLETALNGTSSMSQYTTRVPPAVDFSIVCPSNLAPFVLAERRRTPAKLDQMRQNYWTAVDKHILSYPAMPSFEHYCIELSSKWPELTSALGQGKTLLPNCALHYYATVENHEILTEISRLEEDAENI